MHDVYGLNLTTGVLHVETGRWLRVRIAGLLGVESRLYHAMSARQRKPNNEG